jgi:hypothetical protein
MIKVGNQNTYEIYNIVYGNNHFELVNIYYQVANALNSCNDEIISKTCNKKKY